MTKNSWIRGWDIASHSDPEKTYRVSLALGGHYGCSCLAWKFHKAPKIDCKHILDLKNNLGIVDQARVNARVDRLLGTRARDARPVVKTASFIITELTQAELLAAPMRRKVRRGAE